MFFFVSEIDFCLTYRDIPPIPGLGPLVEPGIHFRGTGPKNSNPIRLSMVGMLVPVKGGLGTFFTSQKARTISGI